MVDIYSNKGVGKHTKLVGWTNPFERYARQIGSFPQGFGVEKKIFKTTTQKTSPSDRLTF